MNPVALKKKKDREVLRQHLSETWDEEFNESGGEEIWERNRFGERELYSLCSTKQC